MVSIFPVCVRFGSSLVYYFIALTKYLQIRLYVDPDISSYFFPPLNELITITRFFEIDPFAIYRRRLILEFTTICKVDDVYLCTSERPRAP